MTGLAGFRHLPGYLGPAEQAALLGRDPGRDCGRRPCSCPTMPRTGKPFSVRMSNCGPLGWVSDKTAATATRPASRHRPALARHARPACSSSGTRSPATRARPRLASSTTTRPAPRWARTATRTRRIRRRPSSRSRWATMPPSTSAACSARDPKQRLVLRSGDVVVLGGAARLAYHGIDRIHPARRPCCAEGGRLNLTLRRVRPTLGSAQHPARSAR